MPARGVYQFDLSAAGTVLDSPANLTKLRNLFLDKRIIGNALGPGDPGDFDHGGWHISCHLAGAAAVFRQRGGKLLWLEISHVPAVDVYCPTVTVETAKECVRTFPADSSAGKALLRDGVLLGYVEGSSLGHISARDVADSPDRFNKWKRQDFDMDPGSTGDGGRVWEHWCTLRDIRETDPIGSSVLASYLTMLSHCGGTLTAFVARGRRQYDHPRQLAMLVKAGLIPSDDALIDITPKRIPDAGEKLFYSADPVQSLRAAGMLEWPRQGLSYYMYQRKIGEWSPVNKVKEDFAKYSVPQP